MNTQIITTSIYTSPCGSLMLGEHNGHICLCDWTDSAHASAVISRLSRHLRATTAEGSSELLAEAARQLDSYFSGQLRHFTLPLCLCGTPFQKSVWEALLSIPFGATLTYGDLAALVGKQQAVRAVANAVGANAISVIIPCHRIIGAGGALTGYAGGLAAKSALLNIERKCNPPGL